MKRVYYTDDDDDDDDDHDANDDDDADDDDVGGSVDIDKDAQLIWKMYKILRILLIGLIPYCFLLINAEIKAKGEVFGLSFARYVMMLKRQGDPERCNRTQQLQNSEALIAKN
uniref:Uncharacterized protein n=1 Tax=Glossina austeni TaxID=7395 RepID=A0A1A9V2D2_GLOAU